jgi:arsenical pump membrane protein
LSDVLVWAVAGLSILLMLLRPKRTSEALWVCLGAAALVLTGLVSTERAAAAARAGLDVYLFLAGMMVLAELARQTGVFDWLADITTRRAKGSCPRLFLLVYLTGTIVTILLSNDATAVVLTPAVLAAVRRAEVNPRAYLLACAFVANAASFVLPISNPANLVVYGTHLPPLFTWLRIFWLASLASIACTFLGLRWLERRELRQHIPDRGVKWVLKSEGRLALAGLLAGAGILLAASARGRALGVPSCAGAVIALLLVCFRNHRLLGTVARGVSWSVLPLVAGLFVIVEALNGAGLLDAARFGLARLAATPLWVGKLAAGFSVALASNVMNNLPVALAGGAAVERSSSFAVFGHAVLLGVDLGPNLSVSGSLATILWLVAMRREDIEITAWQFLKAGAVIMPVALFLALLTCAH